MNNDTNHKIDEAKARLQDVKGNIEKIILMGGSVDRGNHTPYAEFNTFADPEALQVCIDSGLPIYMVGLNLTHQALATTEVVEKMKNMSHEVGQVAAAWMGFFGNSYNKVWNFEAPPVHDPCTIAALIEPDLIEWQKAFVVVETKGEWTRGATSVDLFKRWPDQEPNVYVAMKLDASRYWNLVLESVENVGRK